MTEETKIPTIEELKEKALKITDSIPNLREKNQFMTEVRGQIIELSIIIEMCFNQLITSTGKEMVFDREKKELHLIKGIRSKNDLPKFRTKSRDMKKLIGAILKNYQKSPEYDLFKAFDSLIDIRDIFAHVPVNWNCEIDKLEFSDTIEYKHFFKNETNLRNVFFALKEFTELHRWIIDAVLAYNRSILINKEFLSIIHLGKSSADFEKELKAKMEEKNG